MDASNVIIFPEFSELKQEVDKLRTELSMLLLERDNLVLVECKNIETAYMLAIGSLECKAYELHCLILRLKRKIELIQAKKNRQEKVIISEIEEILDEEFESYREKLEEKIEKINSAMNFVDGVDGGKLLSKKEVAEIKKLYRQVVKALHPDLHPDISDAQLNLFHNARRAYENGDLKSMRIIAAILPEKDRLEDDEDGIGRLKKEKDRLTEVLAELRRQIQDIKQKYPYTMKPIIQSEEKTEEKKAELNKAITDMRESIELYNAKVEELLG